MTAFVVVHPVRLSRREIAATRRAGLLPRGDRSPDVIEIESAFLPSLSSRFWRLDGDTALFVEPRGEVES